MYAVIGILVLVILVLVFLPSGSMPQWARYACSNCGSDRVRWMKGQDSAPHGEAKFLCKACGHVEHRGGSASEIAMENWEAQR